MSSDVGIDEDGLTLPAGSALVIKLNRRIGSVNCTLCQREFEPDPGPELYTEVPRGHVCRHCARHAAPELVALLALAKASECYMDALLLWADKSEPED